MARRRRNEDNLLEMLWTFTEVWWQFGAALTAVLIIGSIWSLWWAIDGLSQDPGPYLQALQPFRWVRFLIPLVLFGFAYAYGVKTFTEYQKTRERW